MSGALDPIQQDLPLDLPPTPQTPPATPDVIEPAVPNWHARAAATPMPPSLYEQALRLLRTLPWRRWQAQAGRLQSQATPVLRSRADQLGLVARVAITRGTPYTIKLVRATAQVSLLRALPLLVARTIHLFGFPAVVVRTSIQYGIAHRMGLVIDEIIYFRVDDPAGYTVYEAPTRLGSALAIAYIPALSLWALALICLAPALAPRATLHLPTTWLTWVQLWLGLAFAAHALPSYEEAGPVAEQARVGVAQADPVAVFWVIPAQLVAVITRFGGILPAIVGALVAWWLAGAVFK